MLQLGLLVWLEDGLWLDAAEFPVRLVLLFEDLPMVALGALLSGCYVASID